MNTNNILLSAIATRIHEKLDIGAPFHIIFHHLQSFDKSLIDCLYERWCSIRIAN